jgi:hypothetical protein
MEVFGIIGKNINFCKLICISLILLLLIVNLNNINAQILDKEFKNISTLNNFNLYDQIDQYQKNYTINENYSYDSYKIFYKNAENYQWCAQSFRPSLPVLTKVNLLIYKINISCILILSIKDNLSGNDLVVMSKDPNEIYEKNNIKWITFNFPDIKVIPNSTYYIVVKCYYGCNDNENNPNCYSWIYGYKTDYILGETWIINKLNSYKWTDLLTYDFCFETYGCTNRPPNNPKIEGPTTGKVGEYYEYTFQTTDPDEDDIYYCVEDGKFNNEICMGPFESGEKIKATFSWPRIGSYNIRVKARDTKGAESEWVTLEVKMPIIIFNTNLRRNIIIKNWNKDKFDLKFLI